MVADPTARIVLMAGEHVLDRDFDGTIEVRPGATLRASCNTRWVPRVKELIVREGAKIAGMSYYQTMTQM